MVPITRSYCKLSMGPIFLVLSIALFIVSISLPLYYRLTLIGSSGSLNIEYGAFQMRYSSSDVDVQSSIGDSERTFFIDQNCKITSNFGGSDTITITPPGFNSNSCTSFNAFRALLVMSLCLCFFSVLFMFIGIRTDKSWIKSTSIVLGLIVVITSTSAMSIWINLISKERLTTINQYNINRYGASFWTLVATIPLTFIGTLIFFIKTREADRKVQAQTGPMTFL